LLWCEPQNENFLPPFSSFTSIYTKINFIAKEEEGGAGKGEGIITTSKRGRISKTGQGMPPILE
jgi:hypothetical protein